MLRLAPAPLKIAAVVFLSPQSAGRGPLLKPLPKSVALAKLSTAQAYAANQPEWTQFSKRILGLETFELRRGQHPFEGVEALSSLLESTA